MSDEHIVTVGDLDIDTVASKAWLKGEPVHCKTQLAVKLLALMAERRTTIVTKRMALRHLYPNGEEADQRIIDVVITYLRKALPSGYVETIWGRGCILRDPHLNRRSKERRWTTARKAEMIAQISAGEISLQDACRQHEMSIEEFIEWDQSITRHGIPGLRTTRIQIYDNA